jgi:hypothetical protein
MSPDLSVEITAIATAVLAAFAIVTAVVAYMVFRKQREALTKQSEEVNAIQRQVEDQEARRRSQAVEITAWLHPPARGGPWEAHIRNASDQPIFDVRTFFYEICKKPGEGREPVLTGGPPPRDETICVFPPDSSRAITVPERVRVQFQDLTERTCIVGIEFTDAAEQDCERDPHGALHSPDLYRHAEARLPTRSISA